MLLAAIQTRENTLGRDTGDPKETLRGMEELFELTAEAARRGAGLIVTIETANVCGERTHPERETRYEAVNHEAYERLAKLSKTSCIVAGLNTVRDGRFYNSAVVFDRGKLLGAYDKIHLPADEQGSVTPGDGFRVFETSAGRVGPMVCWDMQFPESGRILAMMGADVIACPTWGWEDIFRCRAYENSVPMAVAMGVPESGEIWPFCAPSCIVDNMGVICAQGTYRDTGIVMYDLDLSAGPEPQYGSGAITGKTSMRDIRRSQRLPDRYGYLTRAVTELDKRYDNK